MDQLILDRYRLVERLASGGSAEVWRAHDEMLDRAVAVKRLHAHLLPDESSRRRLAAEARAAGQLSHPAIVEIYDVDTADESPAIVMELVDGESLASRIERDGPLTAANAARVTADVAEAVYHAHERGVVHRDVKPGNVLLSVDGRTRLVDFGIAYSLAEAAERLTVTGTVIGTPASMAPEQLAGGPIGPWTDLYGLGVVLHEALTGRPPYRGGSPLSLAEAQRAGPPPLDGVDPMLAALVAACLAHDPQDRPRHADEVAARLRSWVAGDSSTTLPTQPVLAPVPLTDMDALTQPIRLADSAPPPTPHSTGRTGRMILGTAAGAIALIVAIAVIALGGAPVTGDPSVSPSEATSTAPVALPTPTLPPPPPLSGWARKLAENYEEECGTAFDPALIEGMNRQEAEDAVEPVIKVCKENREGD